VTSREVPRCKVYFGPGVWANWTAFVAANPSYRLPTKPAFVIADVQGDYTVSTRQLHQVALALDESGPFRGALTL
jgi:hypothetical protein